MESNSLVALSLIATVIACVYVYLRSIFSYWKNRGIPYVNVSVFWTALVDLLLGRTTIYGMQMKFYDALKGHKYGGYYEFFKGSLMVRDPELIERIIIKDFNNFMDRDVISYSEDNLLTMNLAVAEGDRWRNMRYKLTPTFSSGKLKGMVEQMHTAGDDLIRYIDEQNRKGNDQLDGKPLMSRFGLNVIATCAFGIEFQYQDKERERFLAMVRRVFSPSLQQILRTFGQLYFLRIFKFFRISLIDTEAEDYFVGLIKEAFKYRTESKTRRNDFVQLLLDLKENEDNGAGVQSQESAGYEPEDAVTNQMHHVSGHGDKSVEKTKREYSEEWYSSVTLGLKVYYIQFYH